MIDFLTRLTHRTLGLGPRLEPRLPSLYEPTSTDTGSLPLSTREIEDETDPPPAVAAALDDPLPAANRATAPAATPAGFAIRPARPRDRAEDAVALPLSLRERRKDPVPGSPRTAGERDQGRGTAERSACEPVEPTARLEESVPSPLPIASRDVRDRSPASTPEALRVERPGTEAAIARPSTRAPGPGEPPERGALPAAPHVEPDAAVRHVARERARPSSSGAPVPWIPRAARAPFPRTRRGSTTPSTPNVVVTIGRVEVRATPLPRPSRPTTPSHGAMSLDQYLRREKRGRA